MKDVEKAIIEEVPSGEFIWTGVAEWCTETRVSGRHETTLPRRVTWTRGTGRHGAIETCYRDLGLGAARDGTDRAIGPD